MYINPLSILKSPAGVLKLVELATVTPVGATVIFCSPAPPELKPYSVDADVENPMKSLPV
jgi:hypothetical protein